MSLVYDVVVLAGGGARRLDGADKPGLKVGDRTLLQRVVDAARGAGRVVVVGPHRELSAEPGRPPVSWVQEQPAGAGPVGALQVGLAEVGAPVVVLLAADLPFLPGAVVDRLARIADAGSGGVVLDDGGRQQWLLSAWPTALLRAALVGAAADASVRSVLAGLPWAAVEGTAEAGYDCDTFAELAEARRRDGLAGDLPTRRTETPCTETPCTETPCTETEQP